MKIDRLISIVMVLMEEKRLTAKRLSEMFEVAERTIYRDIETINLAGIPIYSVSGVGGGFEILSEYKIDKKLLSTSDFISILMGLGSVSSMMTGDEIVNTLAKMKSLIPADKKKEIEVKSNQITIDLNPWMQNRNIQTKLGLLKKVIHSQKIITFDYFDRNNRDSSRKIEPYQLMMKDKYWYIKGYCLKRNDFRLFKVSRMSNLQIVDETFVLRDVPKEQSDFSNKMADQQIIIKLLVKNSILDKVLEHCDLDHVIPYDDESSIINFPFIDDDYGYSLLLGYGDSCECLEPANIRNEMKRRITNLYRLYKKNSLNVYK